MIGINTLLSMQQKKAYMAKMIALPNITLSPEEADRFIEYVWDQSVLKNIARKVMMDSETKNIRGMGLSGRFLIPADEFDSSKYKKTFLENRIQLVSKHFRAAILIKDTDLEDINVGTPEAFKSTIMSMATKKMANELEEILWIADTNSYSGFTDDDARSELDGWRYQLDHSQSGETYENDVTGSAIILDASNTVTAKAADFTLTTSQAIAEQNSSDPFNWEFKYNKMLQYLPSQYKRMGLANFRLINSDQVTYNYMTALEDRGTALGDAAILGQASMKYHLTPIVDMPLMPTTMEIYSGDVQKENFDEDNGDLTDSLLTWPQNLVVGFQRELKMEAERSAADEGTYFFFSTRLDAKVEDVHSCVLLKRLKVV